MFVSDHHLPQLLTEADYSDPAVYQSELERLFLPGWHCVATRADFPEHSQFITRELFDRPLLLWNREGHIKAFLNVCTHRFATLTDRPCGKFGDRIKCQYHGWEYDDTGNTCKIPDAQHFRPLKKGELGLREYRCETLGQLVFVSLNPDAVPLRDFLGPAFCAWCEQRFTSEHRLTCALRIELACNWKIVIENVLEAYHIECVHPQTFRTFPKAEFCEHRFYPTFDHYTHDYTRDPQINTRLERFLAKAVGVEPNLRWDHALRYPNVIYGGAGLFHYLQTILPTGPQTCVATWHALHYSGPRPSWRAFLLHRLMKRIGRPFITRVAREDAAIYPSIHRGTVAPDRPLGGGLVSAREERIFAFQRYWLQALGRPIPARAQPFAEELPADGEPAPARLAPALAAASATNGTDSSARRS